MRLLLTTTATAAGAITTTVTNTTTGGRCAEVKVVGLVDGAVDVARREKGLHGMKDSRYGSLSSCRPCILDLLDQTSPAQA